MLTLGCGQSTAAADHQHRVLRCFPLESWSQGCRVLGARWHRRSGGEGQGKGAADAEDNSIWMSRRGESLAILEALQQRSAIFFVITTE